MAMRLFSWAIPVFVWTAWIVFTAIIRRLSTRPDDPRAGFALLFLKLAARLIHRLKIEGKEHIPRSKQPGPLLIVANHTAGVDPLLIQAAMPAEVRWIMAADMRRLSLDRLWKWARVIFVDRHNGSGVGLKDAARELKAGGVVGIFPEGALERPPRSIGTFHPGVGLLIRRSRARVLPVAVDGTPIAETARESLLRFSYSRLRFMPIVDYAKSGLSASEIAQDLQRRFIDCTGWPRSEEAKTDSID
jgi:1-acyl-sn-glycerol-3-phosphate acyltransferase